MKDNRNFPAGKEPLRKSPLGKRATHDLRIPQIPLEWLDSGAWRLPSGQALAEFALQAGFLTPLLFHAEKGGKRVRTQSSKNGTAPAPATPAGAGPVGKQGGRR